MPYRYDPVRTSPYGATIGDMMLRQGDIAANQAQQVAAAKARGVQNIGAGIANGLQDIAAYKAAAPQREMQQLQLEAAREAGKDRTSAREDHELARHNAITTQIGLELHNSGNTLEAMQAALDKAEKNKLITSEQAQQFGAMVSADPSKIPHVAQAWIGATPAGQAMLEKTVTVKPGEKIINTLGGDTVAEMPATPPRPVVVGPGQVAVNPQDGTTVATGPAKEPTPKGYQHIDKLLDGKPTTLLLDPSPGGKIYDLSGAPIDNAATRVKPIPAASIQIANSSGTKDDADAIADAIANGEQPPVTTGLFRLAGPVRAALAKRGFDLTKANLDFEATKKHLATLNGSKITTMRSSITTATDSLDVIDNLAKQWDAGRFPMLNKANLTLAKSGAYGKNAAEIATQLEGQITDVVSELGQVYMGGNSPTDHALKLAEKNLSAAWDKDVLLSMTKLARTNLKIRSNSITNSGAVLSGGPAEGAGAPKPTHRFNPATGKVEPITGGQ